MSSYSTYDTKLKLNAIIIIAININEIILTVDNNSFWYEWI